MNDEAVLGGEQRVCDRFGGGRRGCRGDVLCWATSLRAVRWLGVWPPSDRNVAMWIRGRIARRLNSVTMRVTSKTKPTMGCAFTRLRWRSGSGMRQKHQHMQVMQVSNRPCVAAILFWAGGVDWRTVGGSFRFSPSSCRTKSWRHAPPKSSSFTIDTAPEHPHHAAAMGVQKKTRKFAQVKRVIGG